MPTTFTKGAQNAKIIGESFTIKNVKTGTETVANSTTTAVTAHGLSATPTFILASGSTAAVTYAADATNVTWTKASTTGTVVVSYFLGVVG